MVVCARAEGVLTHRVLWDALDGRRYDLVRGFDDVHFDSRIRQPWLQSHGFLNRVEALLDEVTHPRGEGSELEGGEKGVRIRGPVEAGNLCGATTPGQSAECFK